MVRVGAWRLPRMPSQMHQTTGIDRGHELGAGRGHTVSFGISHGAGDIGELGGKGSAKTAAFLGADHFNQLQPIHLAQKLERFVAQLQLAEPVAGSVIGNRVREVAPTCVTAATFTRNSESSKVRLAKAMASSRNELCSQQLRVKHADHAVQEPEGRRQVGILEDANKMLGTRPRLVPISRVESGLAATSLVFRELDCIPQSGAAP
jgi:hypothetical protein